MSVRSRRIAAFLRLAEEEVSAARLLVEPAPRQTAYLCQQSSEKIARALLADADVMFGPGHSLDQMAAAFPRGHPWIERIRILDKHSPAATRYRYPSSLGKLFDPPDEERLRADVEEIAELLVQARKFLARDKT
ncbi:MAG TPA: HEPN domain-containing protein [Thermoanaerobaculia bacterium]|jgi:HEPN domain-containing protein